MLRELLCRLIPFNYIIPGQAVNRLPPFARILDEHPSLRRHLENLQPDSELSLGEPSVNQFSAEGYRVINFVADLPLRRRRLMRHMSGKCDSDDIDPRGVVYVLTEFQVADAQTAIKTKRRQQPYGLQRTPAHRSQSAPDARQQSKKPASARPGCPAAHGFPSP